MFAHRWKGIGREEEFPYQGRKTMRKSILYRKMISFPLKTPDSSKSGYEF